MILSALMVIADPMREDPLDKVRAIVGIASGATDMARR
jgi:hypothetical protein